MEMIENYKRCLSMYATFEGRSRRRDFWLFVLMCFLISAAAAMVEAALLGLLGGALVGLINLFHLVPWLAASVRRLHDINKTGWWMLLMAIPLLGHLVLLIMQCIPGDKGPNQYGPDPKATVVVV